jgi:hypothetical protein
MYMSPILRLIIYRVHKLEYIDIDEVCSMITLPNGLIGIIDISRNGLDTNIMTDQQLLLPLCCSAWLLHVYVYIQRVGMLAWMNPPRCRTISTEKLILISTSHFPADVKRNHTAYLVNINET